MERGETESNELAHPESGRCRCGYAKNDPHIRPAYQYSLWGQFALAFLMTPLAQRIDLVCPACGDVVGSITDPESLQRFRYHEPKPGQR